MWKRFFKQVDKVLLGGVTAVFTFLQAFLWYVFPRDYSVPMWIIYIILIICYIICLFIYASGRTQESIVVYKLPSVRKIIIRDDEFILIVEKNELYAQDALVTIYYQEDEDHLEDILGIGFVETINSQGNLQIKFVDILNPIKYGEIFTYELIEKKQVRQALFIKPTVLKRYIESGCENE